MISPLRAKAAVQPFDRQTPQDDLYELSWQEGDRETPDDQYKTPLDSGRRKSTSVEGWVKPEQSPYYRITERRSYGPQSWRKDKKPVSGKGIKPSMSRTNHQMGSSVELNNNKEAVEAALAMKKTQSQDLGSKIKSLRKRFVLMPETFDIGQTEYYQWRLHEKKGFISQVPSKRVSVEAVNYPIIEHKKKDSRGRPPRPKMHARLRLLMQRK